MARKRSRKSADSVQQPLQTQSGETIINQLFGSLESEPNIEEDIAALGGGDEQTAPEKPKKSRFFFVFAVFVIIMAIIGCVSSVRAIMSFTGQLLDNTSQKNEFAQFIYPVVVNDIPPFDSVSELANSVKITCGIWNILINKDTSKYESGTSGQLTIPEYDVSASCKELFGSSVTLEHQTVGTAEVRFTYDSENSVYSAAKNIRYLTYAPTIVEMTETTSGTYTLIVGYLPPSLATVSGVSGLEVTPEKYMEYTISVWDGQKTLMSVRFTDYQPES